MLDIRFIRENPDAVKENIKKKFQEEKLPLIDQVIELDRRNRDAMTEANNLRAARNTLSKQVGVLMGQAKKDPSKLEEAEAAKAQVKANADRLAELEQLEDELAREIHKILLVIPQMIDPSVPIGPDDSANVEVERFGEGREHFYIVPDYTTDEQGRKIVEVFGENRLITGGSGILEHMAARYREEYDCRTGEELPTWTPGRGIALSGSCSTATCGQCQAYETEYPAIPVYPARILAGSQSAEEIWETVRSAGAGAGEIAQSAGKEAACQCAGVPEFLVYSAGATDPESRRYKDEEEAARASQALEETMAKLGKMAFDDGYTRIIVAGGETSGAVALALGFDAFIIGESIAPGVPVLIPLHNQNVRLALKSGNFGQRDFFARALSMTRDPKEAAPPKCGGMLDWKESV